MSNTQKGHLLALFLISPFMGLLTLFKSKNKKFFEFFGVFFFGLVGSLFVYVDGTDGHSHYQNAKEHYLNMSFIEFFERSYEIITFSATEGTTDMYLHVISFISASIFQTPALIHVITGVVLGYFFTNSVLLLLKDHLFVRKGTILLGFIVLFLTIRSISALNSIRMWTAMWILFYGTYGYAVTKRKKYIYITLSSILVHFSYLVIIVPVVLSYLLRKRKSLMTFLFIASFFVSVGFSTFSSFVPQTELLQNKQKYNVIDSHEDEIRFEERRELAEQANKNKTFYAAFGTRIYLDYSIVGLSIILLIFYWNRNIDASLLFLITIGIGLYTFGNFATFSPSLAGRTKMISSIFITAAAIRLQLNIDKYHIRSENRSYLNTGLALFLISSIPMLLYNIVYIMWGTSIFFLLFPPISWFLGVDDFSIREALGLFVD